MRHLLRCSALTLAFVGLTACSNTRPAAQSAATSPAMVDAYGSLAAGDSVGRAAFNPNATGSDRFVSVPISIED